MTSSCNHQCWRCYCSEDDSENPKKFSCNIFLQTKHQCLDAKIRKKEQIEAEWRDHIERVENLSRPITRLCEERQMESQKVPLKQLLPRLCRLSRPRFVTPKYEKPVEEPFCLPGTLKDWKAHKLWLEERAQPKRDHAKFFETLQSFKCASPKITHSGLIRIHQLARPRHRPSYKIFRPRSTKRMASAVCRMSQTKVCCYEDHSNSHQLKTSKSASAYQASERTKSLALPPHENLRQKKGVRFSDKAHKCFCCFRSVSCGNVLPSESSTQLNESFAKKSFD